MSNIEASLAKLGDNPIAIANALLNAGARGERDCPSLCPVACYLRGLGFEPVSVGAFSVYAMIPWGESQVRYELEMSPALKEFVEEFDDGKYPQLEVVK